MKYLRAIGLKARHVVIQRGSQNYAGANCPGTGWKCTSTAYPVIQIASAGGGNTFQCATASCAVVQVADASSKPNSGTCIKTSGLGQSCSISQTGGGPNKAVVYENTGKSTGLTQTASSTASITQLATGANTNRACVTQVVNIDGSTNASGKKGAPVNVTLEAHQSITITQDATSSGANSASEGATSSGDCTGTEIAQTQTLNSTATGTGSITQNENASNSGANMTLDIEQNQGAANGQATGTNSAIFNQTNSLTATANGPGTVSQPLSQTQSSVGGGILGKVNQDSSGMSTAVAKQAETQCEDAASSGLSSCATDEHTNPGLASLTQKQFGPIRKAPGDSSQTGNSNDSFTVTQSSQQDSDTGSTQTNVVAGGFSTSGTGTVNQSTNVNGTTSSNTASGQNVNAQTNCTGSACTTTGGPSLTILPNGLSVSNADIAEFGVGGMRVNCASSPNCVQGDGTGSIAVGGITGTVFRAFLYWHGPTNSTDPASNASVTFGGTPITGTNIGIAHNNNWGFQNSQAYRADVTSLVTGNGTYSLSNFTKADADINGAALIVFYDDANASNNRNVVLWNGNDSNIAFGSDPADWAETISGVNYPGSGAASLDLVVADGQSFSDADVVLNGNTGDPVATGGSIFQGDSVPPNMVNGLWDVKSFDITRFLTTGSNTLNLTSGTVGDALSLVVAIANVPATAPVIP